MGDTAVTVGERKASGRRLRFGLRLPGCTLAKPLRRDELVCIRVQNDCAILHATAGHKIGSIAFRQQIEWAVPTPT